MAEQTTETTETTGHAAGEEHSGGFPPFDSTHFGSQILWLAITFGLLYYLMSKVALPRIASILEERNDRIADDLAEAEKLKQETDEAIAAYEQALAEARQNAHGIAEKARDKAKAEIGASRSKIEGDLEAKVADAEERISKVKAEALAEVDTIAKDTTGALVEVLIGGGASSDEIGKAVDTALAERRR
ncbi:MAG TPA: F0F1 ATP synthase subunit B [Afifellaceae bacterium]|nr:F0F1 ATP synthase subunit B [Afifellaceae bacterium]